MLSTLDRLAYRSQHFSFLLNATMVQEAARLFARKPRPVLPPGELRALMQRLRDLGCGTGRTLHQLSRAHPQMRLYGVDLSPAYVRLARKRLAEVGELTLAVENGEHMPFADATFDVVTSVYLFHELPRNARRN